MSVFKVPGCQILFQKLSTGTLGKHASLCNAISTLENESRENMETVFVSHLTPDQHQKVAKLVGKRCTVFCKMNGKTVEVLWDTGAQVSITSKDWLENNFPDLQVKSIQCLLDCGPELDLSAANGTKIKYIGYVEIDFRLNSNDRAANNCTNVSDHRSHGLSTYRI